MRQFATRLWAPIGSRLSARVVRIMQLVGVAVLAGIVAIVALGFAPATRGEVGPGTVSIRATLSTSGWSTLAVPPLGEISAQTHRGPISFTALVNRIDVDAAQSLLSGAAPAATLRQQAEEDLASLVRRFAIRSAVMAGIVGLLVGLVLPHRRWSFLGVGVFGAVASVTLVLAGAWASFRPEAFANPRYEGPIRQAPQLFATVSQYVNNFGQVRDRIEALTGQITDLYATTQTESIVAGPGQVRVLHVSDIHLNPIGLEVTRELAEQFGVDAIIDTGDITSFGLALEARFSELIAEMAAPYYLVPGNHDSPAVRAALANDPDINVLDGDHFDLGPVRVLGVGHPSFTATNELSREDVRQDIRDQGVSTRTLVRRIHPDVLAVHDPAQAQVVLGEVPLVIAGHLHETTSETIDGTLVLTVGSTGATGLGSLTIETDLPYEAQVLSFNAAGHLVAIDHVTLRGTEGGFRIDRQLLNVPESPTGSLQDAEDAQ